MRYQTGVYRIRNILDNCVYIGGAYISFLNRKADHFGSLRRGEHKNERLQRAWNKYGEENFVFEVIGEYPKHLVETVEQTLLEWLWTQPKEMRYNMCPTVGSRLGAKLTEEQKKKMSGKKLSEIQKVKLRDAQNKPETILRKSEAAKAWWKENKHKVKPRTGPFSEEALKSVAEKRAVLTREQVSELIRLRVSDPRRWTYSRLGIKFKCAMITAYRTVVGDNRR